MFVLPLLDNAEKITAIHIGQDEVKYVNPFF
ncbi:hypothetical protein C7475_103363 [Chitinophaga sp. S165]|nr:hypothetical protein C7475_103363 [Chitinophaga sp. S165]